MSLTEIMSSLRLSTYPQIALVIFLVVFAAIVWRVIRRSAQSEMDEAAAIPLNEDVLTPREPHARNTTPNHKAEV